MIDDEQLGRVGQALEYWSLIDFLTQDSLPDTQTHASFYCSKKNASESKSPISVSHKFEHKLGSATGETVHAYVESKVAAACRKRAGYLSKKASASEDETNELGLLRDAIANNAFPPLVAIDIFLCIIPKEPVIAALEDKLAASLPSSKERQEIETDNLTSALVHINESGKITELEISPVIWLLASNSPHGDAAHNMFGKELEGRAKNIVERYGQEPATFDDLQAIASELMPNELLKRIHAFEKEHPSYEHRSHSHPLCRSIISYQAFDDPDRKPFRESLHSSFYSKDIRAVRDAIGDASEHGDGASYLARGQLKLVLSYLEGGLEHHEERDLRRLDIQSHSDEVSSFYQQVLSLNNTPLGRWPSKYSLSLMQQVAVNLTAGDGIDQVISDTAIPVSDVMSVNGPPGTGKTTLLKDIIAANIVKKAFLLSGYEHPDQAFSEIEGTDQYLKFAKRAYRLNDPRIADLGIIVCSSNNTAVENISKELPQGAELLGGLESEEKDRYREQAMFRGDADNAQNLFETTWKAKGDKGPQVIPDLYFSRIARAQFDKSETVGEPFDMLISARLGKKDNIDAFRDHTLEKLIYAQNKSMREDHVERFRRSARAFRNQYETVRSLMENYGDGQDEILRKRTSLNKARLQLERAESRLEEATRLNEDAQLRLSNAFSCSIQQLASNIGAEDRLAHVNNIQGLQELEDQLREELAPYTSELVALKNRLESARQPHGRMQKLLGALAKSKQEAKISKAEQELSMFQERNAANERLARFKGEVSAELEKLEGLTRTARAADKSAVEARADLKRAEISCAARRIELDDSQASCPHALTSDQLDSITGEDPDQGNLHKAHLFTPAANIPDDNVPRLRYERDKLFLRALQVTRDFILSSNHMASNFRLLDAYWGAAVKKADGTGWGKIAFSDEDASRIVPALFQTLSILTPVISTTFASAGRLFRDIPISNAGHAPLGLCIIDEAGQAVPQAAVGALARCDKALVVGDPYQIEPVVDSEVKMYTRLLGKAIDYPFKSCTSSVQVLADAVNPVGCRRINDEGETEWIGCPLVVHRRCVSPMFEISNEISYGKTMLNETAKLDPEKDKEKLESFYLPSSQWINVAGPENGNKDHYVAAQGMRAQDIVLSAFAKKPKDAEIPSLYIISPFSTVSQGMRTSLKTCRPDSVKENDWESFLEDNIGTVHKFQGKEAQEVIFMLGCDASASGAVKWVNPNIVNVAASRAKQRLYVIADYNVWKQNEYVRTMKRIIDTAWVDLWNDSQADGGKGIENVLNVIPRLESLPTSSLTPAEADSDPAGGQGSKPGDALQLDTENVSFDTGSFLENMRPYVAQLALSPSVCRRFGFEDESSIDAEFAACADIDGPVPNPVLANIKMGMFLYDLFDIDRKSAAGAKEDWSFCAIMFCRAAELLLQRELLPSLKAINPTLHVTGKQTIADMQELGLGQYHHALCKTDAKVACGMAAGYRCGNDTELTGSVIDGATPRDPAWWKAFGRNLGKLAKTRNEFCHAGRSTTPDIQKLLARLFGNHIKQEGQASHAALLCESRTLELAKEGIGSKDFPRTAQELERGGAATAVPVPAIATEPAVAMAAVMAAEATPAKAAESASVMAPGTAPAVADNPHEGKYLSLGGWKAELKKSGDLDGCPELFAGAQAINKALENAGYITKAPRVFTKKGKSLLDVKETDDVDGSGKPYKKLLYSHEGLLAALKIYQEHQSSK